MPLTDDQIKKLMDAGASDAEIVSLAKETPAPASRSWGDVARDAVQGVKKFVTGGLDTNALGSMLEPLAHPQTGQDIGNLILAGAPGSGFLGAGDAAAAGRGLSDVASGTAGAVKSGVNTLATAVRDDPSLAKLAQGRPVAAATSLAGRAAKAGIGKIADLTAETPIVRNPSAIAESAAAAQLPRDASAMAGAPMLSPPGPGILQTVAPSTTIPGGGAADIGTIARQEIRARELLHKTTGGIISQLSAGDPDMAAHLQRYVDGTMKQALDAGAQPDPATVINALKGEAQGYRASKPVAEPDYMAQLRASLPQVTHPLDTPVDVPTAIMGTNPSPAGVGHAVQALGNEQVKGTLKKLGEQPLWDAFSIMTGEKK